MSNTYWQFISSASQFAHLACHVEPVGAVAPQGVDLESSVGGKEVLDNTRVSGSCFVCVSVSAGLQAIGQVTAHHSANVNTMSQKVIGLCFNQSSNVNLGN